MITYEEDEETIYLESENEIQLTLHRPGDQIMVQLVSGSAEIFGSELEVNKEYKFFYFCSVTIFTSHGCTLKLRKEASSQRNYKIRASTQVPQMRELHEHIEEMRASADANHSDSPIILVAGPTDVGKSTLCRFLLNSAARNCRKPVFIDLDVGQSSLSIAGTFGVLTVEEPSDVNGKFNERSLSVYYFGYKSPGHNMMLYKLLLEKVGRSLTNRLRKNAKRTSGVIIDTCGWVIGEGYKLIKEIIQKLNVNTVLVLSEKELYFKLKKDVPWRTNIKFVNKFTDVVIRSQNVRMNNRDSSVYRYFYGAYGHLEPYFIKTNFNDLQIYKISCSSKNSIVNKVPVIFEPSILYQVCALSYAEHVENIPFTSVYGFVCIVELDVESKIITLLSPKPGPLPTAYLLMGDITLKPKDIPF